MIPNDIEMIVMTKKDYDRNVEQLLFEKLKLEEKIDKAIEYIKKAFPTDFCEMEYEGAIKLLEILGDKENDVN